MTYCFSTDMQDQEIIFGGEKKLRQAIQEAYDNFHPKAIAVFSTCPVGLIGDDVHAVCREMKAKLGINIFGWRDLAGKAVYLTVPGAGSVISGEPSEAVYW